MIVIIYCSVLWFWMFPEQLRRILREAPSGRSFRRFSHPIQFAVKFPVSLDISANIFILHTATRAMAPPKHVAEVPRSLLPRLTWNSSSSRSTIPASHHPALATRQRRPSLQGWSSLDRRLHSLNTPHEASRAFSTSLRGSHVSSSVARQTSTSPASRPSTESLSNPVRHNGVYVATFKPARRAFHPTPSRPRDHHFDTLKFVKRLQAEGFSEEQAVAMMRVLNDIIQESIQNLTRTMVLREGLSALHSLGGKHF